MRTVDDLRVSTERGHTAEARFKAPPNRPSLSRTLLLTSTGYDTLHVKPLPNVAAHDPDSVLATPEAASKRILEISNALALLRRLQTSH